MQYFVAFLEGMITFISPCLLPLLPVYLSYFAGGREQSTAKTLRNVLGFILGFTLVFMLLGALAGTLGNILNRYTIAVNVITGLIVVFFGLNFLGVFRIDLFRGSTMSVRTEQMGFFSALLFGMVFSISWTPCVGAFLGSALALASQRAHMAEGMRMLFAYSMGLGIPFAFSAVLIDYLKSTFNWIKKHYRVINIVCGSLLVLIGILMATGTFGHWLAMLS